MLTTLKRLFWVSRPVSWLNTAYPFAAGYVLTGGAFGPTLIIGTVYFLVCYNLLMYGINDVFDYESDILNPRKGGIEGMREERKFHPAIVKASILTNVPPLLYLSYTALQSRGGAVALAVLVGVIFMVLAYSVKGLRFKEIPILDSITSSLHFVGPLLFALALTDGFSSGWPYIIAFFLWGMASHAFGAVQDIIPDRAGGLSSVATVLGASATVRLTILLYMAASIIVIAQGGLSILVGMSGLAYVINVLKYIAISDERSAATNKAWKRFIWLNYFVGFIVTVVLLVPFINQL